MDIFNLAKEGKIKRYFRSRNKLSAPELISHITQRATGSERLFLEKLDYLYMLSLLKRESDKFNFDIFAFVFMPNHIHFLLQLKEDNLSKSMMSIFGKYATYFNRKYQRKGKLFCGPFRQAVCFDDIYLLVASLYIHLNPVRAGLVNNYYEYKWSSWRLYCQNKDFDAFIKFTPILNLLDQNLKKARSEYKRLLNEGKDIEKGEVLEDKKAIDGFKNKLLKNTQLLQYIINDINKDNYLNSIKLEEMVEEFDKKGRFNSPSEIKGIKFLIEQLLSRGYNKTEIAEMLGITRRTLYKYLNLSFKYTLSTLS